MGYPIGKLPFVIDNYYDYDDGRRDNKVINQMNCYLRITMEVYADINWETFRFLITFTATVEEASSQIVPKKLENYYCVVIFCILELIP